jgi:hypothetical protein
MTQFKAALLKFMVLGARMAANGRVEAERVSICSPQTGHLSEFSD